jgi:protein-disulfide isomerase
MTLRHVLTNVVVAAVVGGLTAAGVSYAVLRHAGLAVSASQQANMDQAIHDYLTKNPEVMVELTNELDKRKDDEDATKTQKAIGDNAEKIFRSPVTFVAGNPSGDVSVVEFFDYNCGYCRQALPQVVKLVDGDSKIRLVLKELPIFGEDSIAAARLAMAANKQGKYFEMHQKLFTERGKANKDKALQIAKELGLDTDQLQKDAEDPAIKQALDENKDLAQKLGLQGTPYYLIGDHTLPGAPDDLYEELAKNAAEIREKGCSGPC